MTQCFKLTTTAMFCGLLLLSGCAKPPEPKIFYPPAPDAPRIQFLGSYSSEYDLKIGGFSRLLYQQTGDIGLHLSRGRSADFFDGKMYVVDAGRKALLTFDFMAKKIRIIEIASNAMRDPMEMTIDKNGVKYISDGTNQQIVVVAPDDKTVRIIPTGDNFKAVGIAVDDKLVYSCSPNHHEIRAFDKNTGELVKTLDAMKGLFWPTALDIDHEGHLAALNMGNFKLTKYDDDGTILSQFGQIGDAHGNFSRPKGLAIDKSGRIFVLDGAFANVQYFKPDGKLLTFFGQVGGRSQDLVTPSSITINYEIVPFLKHLVAPGFKVEYVIAVTSQFGPSKVSLFGFGRMDGVDYSKYED